MPKVNRSPKTSNLLGEYLRKVIEERNLSLRTVAVGAGVSLGYVSDVVNGKNIPDAGVCNALADFLKIPRIKIYRLAGWLDAEFVERLEEASNQYPELKEVLEEILNADEKSRGQLIELLRAGVRK
jgi:transcriptional regulator with XRE-family HTH domain